MGIYQAVLINTLNETLPKTDFQVLFVAIFVTMGAIVNANIFGNIALIVQSLNAKFSEF